MGKKRSFAGVPFWGKMCAGLLCAALLAGSVSGGVLQRPAVGADSIEELEKRAKEIKQENEKRQEEINKYDGNIAENEDAMALVEEQIDGINSEIDAFSALITAKQDEIDRKLIEIYNVEDNIAEKEKEIAEKKVQISALQAENTVNLKRYGQLARYMYMNNTSSQIPVLNGSDDWSTYFLYSTAVNNISSQSYDFMLELEASIQEQNDLIDELNGDIADLENKKAHLEEQKEEYLKEYEKLENDKAELEAYADEKRGELYDLAAENADMRDKINDLTDEIIAGNNELDEINEQIVELIRQKQQENNGKPDYFDYSGGPLGWPVSPSYTSISTYFGYDAWRNGMHRGIDICGGGIHGANVYAAQSGTVIFVTNYCTHDYGKYGSCGCGGGYGNYMIVDHGGGLSTLYAHCSAIYVYEGQFVEQGDVIGAVGSTGWSTGAHLHFETRENGVAVDPFNYVSP